MRRLFCFILPLWSGTALGQVPPADYPDVPDQGNEFLYRDSTGSYFTGTANEKHTVWYAKDNTYYKLYSPQKKLLAEGSFVLSCADCHTKNGAWVLYDSLGNVRERLSFTRGLLNGPREAYYQNGKLAVRKYYTIISVESDGHVQASQSGPYEEYYPSGRLKVTGAYHLRIDARQRDSAEVVNPLTGTITLRELRHNKISSVKTGTWMYYNEEGRLTSTERY